MTDLSELIKRIFKYILMGLIISICAIIIPQRKLDTESVLILALTSAATFAVIDQFLPSMSNSVRGGLGTALGVNMIGLKVLA
jgi:ABC-type Co2+ transport system permease subunit